MPDYRETVEKLRKALAHGRTDVTQWKRLRGRYEAVMAEAIDTLTEQDAELATLRGLAYIGEHHFSDMTWKARCGELQADLATLRAENELLRNTLTAERMAGNR